MSGSVTVKTFTVTGIIQYDKLQDALGFKFQLIGVLDLQVRVIAAALRGRASVYVSLNEGKLIPQHLCVCEGKGATQAQCLHTADPLTYFVYENYLGGG